MNIKTAHSSFTSIVLVAILSLAFYLRLLFFGQIIDADVGNIAYMGWRMAEGEVLIDLEGPGKPPLYSLLYAIFVWLFGPSVLGIKMFGALFVLMAVIAIYWLGNKAYGKGVGLLAALLFGVFSSGPMVEGGTVNLETLLHLPSILAIGFFINGSTTGRLKWYFFAGICGTMAALVKQVGGVIFFAFLCSEIHRGWRMKQWFQRYSILCAGALVPVIGLLLFFTFHGYTPLQLYDSILGSNFRYLQRGYEYRNLFVYFLLSVKAILLENSLLWIGTIFSIILIVFRVMRGKVGAIDRILFWWAFWSFGVLWISGTFLAHYFLQIIAPFSLLAAYGVWTAWDLAKTFSPLMRFVVRGAWLVTLLVTIILFIKTDYKYFLSYSPVEQTVFQYKGLDGIIDYHGYGTFGVVQQEIAFYIQGHTNPTDTIYVWGVSPQLYYLAQRRAATRYRNNFNISSNVTNDPGKELRAYAPVVMEEIKKSPPTYIVQIFPLEMFPELREFVQNYYQIEITVDVSGTPFRIYLYRRRL
ncbi:MAG: hypothetical protein FJ115_05990 [Deltaproteobacteria bacterium]|nr:hypothetical protein [Deltaproteobacteria bacterium]